MRCALLLFPSMKYELNVAAIEITNSEVIPTLRCSLEITATIKYRTKGASKNSGGDPSPPRLKSKTDSWPADSTVNPGSFNAENGFKIRLIEIGTLMKIGVKISAKRFLYSSVSKFFKISCHLIARQFGEVK